MKALVVLLVAITCVKASWWSDYIGDNSGSSEEELQTDGSPAFCKGYDCPQYTIVEKYTDLTFEFELRSYTNTTWVYTKFPGLEGEYWEDYSWQTETYMKLRNYINGNNEQNVTIPMAVPVIKEHRRNTVYMGFMLTEDFAGDPPTPTDPDVFIMYLPHCEMYVSSFDGFAHWFFGHINRFKTKAVDLYMHLLGHKFNFNKSLFYTAVYDSPYTYFDRHNEVWYRKVEV